MKKIIFLFLLCFVGVSLYAKDTKDTLVVPYDDLVKPEDAVVTVLIVIPKSVINPAGTLSQNFHAYNDGKFVQVSQKTERKYKWFWSEDVTKTKMMFFNKTKGKNDCYFKPEVISNHRFAWELWSVFLLMFIFNLIVGRLAFILKFKISLFVTLIAVAIPFSAAAIIFLNSSYFPVVNDILFPIYAILGFGISEILIFIFENKSKK